MHKYRVEEKKISKNNRFVIFKVSRYDYITIMRWAGLVARMYTVIRNLVRKQSMGQNICGYFDVQIDIKLDLGDTKCENTDGICQNGVTFGFLQKFENS